MNSFGSILIGICLLSFNSICIGQTKDSIQNTDQIDTNYITTFPDHIVGRAYLSRKYTNMVIDNKDGNENLTYDPNTSLNFGLGITVNHFTLNLAYGFRFLNQDGEKKGETRHLDLQSHIYKRKFVIDLFGQFYNGLFLNDSNLNPVSSNETFYLRPDISIQLVGITALKVKNYKKFSYAAPFLQNELQHKSAGSFLYGVSASAFFSQSDSNYVPSFITDSIYRSNFDVKQMQAIQIGPNVGYAYSLIIGKRFFATASLNIAFLIGPIKYTTFDNEERKEWQVNGNLSARVGFGYNSPKWYLGITALQDGTRLRTLDETSEIGIGAGNFRINYVKRFLMGPKLKKQVDKLPI